MLFTSPEIDRFHAYSLIMSRKHYEKYTKGQFWEKMQNALMAHNFALKTDTVKMIMCNDFYEGVYLPDPNKVLLCGNVLMEKQDFENALNRQLIMLYDNVRGNGLHNLDNCKHLACSEVRAALFNNSCKVSKSFGDRL